MISTQSIQQLLPRPSRDRVAQRAIAYLISAGVDAASVRYEPEYFRFW